MAKKPADDPRGLTWPIASIDFEASSLEDGGYPIEVGIAVWPKLDAPVYVWATLIRPIEDWLRYGHWSKSSRAVHGISQKELEAGLEPKQVATALNEVFGVVGPAWCDGGPYDIYWARKLFEAAGLRSTFVFGDWHSLLHQLHSEQRERSLQWLETAPSKHRAGDDAAQLLFALANAFGQEPGLVQKLQLIYPVLDRLPGKAS